MQSVGWDIGLLLDWTTASETRGECIVFMTAVYNDFINQHAIDYNNHTIEKQTGSALIDLQRKLYTALKYEAIAYHPDLLRLLNFAITNK
jgi:hypothetical protein